MDILKKDQEWRNPTAYMLRAKRSAERITKQKLLIQEQEKAFSAFTLGICILMAGLMLIGSCKLAHANELVSGYSLDQWADSIYKAENSKKHPYGSMVKYRHTSPRVACINTVRHQWHNYQKSIGKTGQSKRFLEYLANVYCPIGAKNDPLGLNRNWIKNVRHFLQEA